MVLQLLLSALLLQLLVLVSVVVLHPLLLLSMLVLQLLVLQSVVGLGLVCQGAALLLAVAVLQAVGARWCCTMPSWPWVGTGRSR